MIADWRADEDNTFRMTIEINKSKVSAESEKLSILEYDDIFKSFIALVHSISGMERDYILSRSKTLIEEEINNIKRIGLYDGA
jgi:hypothetical protein